MFDHHRYIGRFNRRHLLQRAAFVGPKTSPRKPSDFRMLVGDRGHGFLNAKEKNAGAFDLLSEDGRDCNGCHNDGGREL